MTKRQKELLAVIQDKHFGDWLKTRREVEDEISNRQSMFCVCGRLATGLHESHCRKFSDKVTIETIGRLKHLVTA